MSHQPHNNSGHAIPNERLLDLLVSRATEGLSVAEHAELEHLLASNPSVDAEQFELAAAAAAVAMVEPSMHREGLPASTRDKLIALAGRQNAGATELASACAPDLRLAGTPQSPAARPQVQARSRGGSLGWLAAAAALMLAAIGWWQVVNKPGQASPAPVALAAQFESFKKSADDAIHWPWAGKEKGYEGVKGEVYWSDKLQRGYMLLSGLAPNDPRAKQYQLWIVDPKRDKHPVDGGVFDIAAAPVAGARTATGEVIVPIDCKLKVESPAAFALTVEQPGGVVVSAGPLVVVAAK